MSHILLDSTKIHASFPAPNMLATMLVAIALAWPAVAPAAESAKTGSALAPMTASAHIVKFTPQMRISSLASRPDSDMVEFSDGRRMHVGQLRRLSAWGQKARSTPKRAMPNPFLTKPAATGRPVRNAGDLAAALKRPDSETVQLPSGRLATVGQIKLVMPEVERRLGHRLAVSNLPNLSGPAMKVTAQSDWKHILQQPDSTVLEAPDGQRVTVGMLKQALKQNGPSRQMTPGRSKPTVAPRSSAPSTPVRPR